MCVESREWMKFGGKAFFCFTVSGLLRRDKKAKHRLQKHVCTFCNGTCTLMFSNIKWDATTKSEVASLWTVLITAGETVRNPIFWFPFLSLCITWKTAHVINNTISRCIINIVNHTSAFPAMTSKKKKVCCEKVYLCAWISTSIFIFYYVTPGGLCGSVLSKQ